MSKNIKKTEEELKEEQSVEETVEETTTKETVEEVTEENTEQTAEKEEKEAEKKVKKTDKQSKSDKKEEKEDTKEKKDDTPEPKKDKTKALVGVIVVLVLVLVGLCIYVISNSPNKPNQTAVETGAEVNKSVLTDALNNLKKKENFIVTTYVNAPMGNTSYIEYVTPTSSATLVDDVNIETPYQQVDQSTAQYRYNDLIKDGHMYFFYENADENGNPITEVYQAPDEYAKECGIRSYMFFDLIKDNIQDLKYAETTSGTDLGNGPVDMVVYEGKISSDIVKRILGNGTVVLYDTVRKTTDNEGLKKMMGWLIDDIEFTMQYSDANVLIGVADDTLVYLNLEIGGLGTKMYVTKCFIEDTSVAQKMTEPSTEGAITYENLYADYAEMALNYDSMDDMYDAIYNQSNILSEEELQQILDNAVQTTEEKQGQDIETEIITNTPAEESTTEATTEETTTSEDTAK